MTNWNLSTEPERLGVDIVPLRGRGWSVATGLLPPSTTDTRSGGRGVGESSVPGEGEEPGVGDGVRRGYSGWGTVRPYPLPDGTISDFVEE